MMVDYATNFDLRNPMRLTLVAYEDLIPPPSGEGEMTLKGNFYVALKDTSVSYSDSEDLIKLL